MREIQLLLLLLLPPYFGGHVLKIWLVRLSCFRSTSWYEVRSLPQQVDLPFKLIWTTNGCIKSIKEKPSVRKNAWFKQKRSQRPFWKQSILLSRQINSNPAAFGGVAHQASCDPHRCEQGLLCSDPLAVSGETRLNRKPRCPITWSRHLTAPRGAILHVVAVIKPI